ncbi:sulfotransferase domain-containing protein [Sphingomonas sp. GCM10030256]|uniref:sulfotransferase domain-containing protein n=1 Tax=Sphingomonas sp. GCM10030256 TaxID=3273427 RepID=UPI003613E6CA
MDGSTAARKPDDLGIDLSAASSRKGDWGPHQSLAKFLYIGTSKAGSTWIFHLLSHHPEIFTYPGKNLGFFSNRFANGWAWYVNHFDPGPEHRIMGEICHSYLPSQHAAERVYDLMPDARLIACLREPVARTFSDYLDGIKNGKIEGTFEEALERFPKIVERSKYASHLERYLTRFPRDQIHIAPFDELVSSPEKFAARLFEFLGATPIDLPPGAMDKVLPAGRPRSKAVVRLTKMVALLAYRNGLRELRGRLKTSRTLRNLLYQPYSEASRPKMGPATRERLRTIMRPEVLRLDDLAGTNFRRLWGYV